MFVYAQGQSRKDGATRMKVTLRNRGVAEKYKSLARKLPGVINDVMYNVAVDVRDDFEKTTATWQHQVVFAIARVGTGYVVSTSDEVYGFVDLGTRPHRIEGPLAFQGNYVAKTQPRVIGSSGGGASGPMVYAQGVDHPGTQARKFSETILKKWEKETPKRVQAALRTGLESVGL